MTGDIRLPSLMLQISFTTDPADAPVWVDLPRRLKGFSIRRGRDTDRDQFQAGTATFILDNTDRALDPTNAAGPYYGNIRPMKRCRLVAILPDDSGAIEHPLFTGYTEGYPQGELGSGLGPGECSIRAVDGFKVLSLAGVGGIFPEQSTDERVEAILDDMGWPVADRQIDIGSSDIQEVLLEQSSALANLLKTNEVENGLMFIDANGDFVFVNRAGAYSPATPLATFGGSPTDDEVPFRDATVTFDDSRIWNDVAILRLGESVSETAEDATSQTRYYKRSFRREDSLIVTALESQDLADWLIFLYKEPILQIKDTTVNPNADDRLWPLVLDLEIGDPITVIKRPLNGTVIAQVSFIEAISHMWSTNQKWETTYTLTPRAGREFLILDDDVYGVLDADVARLGY